MNKKYIIISIVSVLVILIGVTLAYYSAVITGDKKKIVINTKELSIVFHNGEEINELEIEAPWTTSKEFSVESKSPDIFYYNIVLQDLINGFTSNTLEYKITCTNGEGYSMNDFEPVPASPKKSDQVLIEGIELQPKATHTYKIEFRYLNSEDIDQSDDMGETLSGSLYITKGEKKEILAEQLYKKMKEQYPATIDIERQHFDQVVGENDDNPNDTYDVSGAYKETGSFTEDGKDVYYYSGNVTNNWVSFAGFYWRIIRTNEDGSIRLLYGGPESDKGNSKNQYIGLRPYNEISNNPMYVGYKYGDSGNLSNNRTNDTNSSILGPDDDTNDSGNTATLNGWYNVNLKENDGQTKYDWDKYISRTAIYCNDRAHIGSYSDNSTMYYAPTQRLSTWASLDGGISQESDIHPSYKCGVDYKGDIITTASDSDKFSGVNGKALLVNPIGLMTVDEIVYAGGKIYTNSSKAYYHLTADETQSATNIFNSWTMSPVNFTSTNSQMFTVWGGSSSSGRLDNSYVSSTVVFRPVISLKSCVQLSDASGEVTASKNDPFEVLPISDTCASKNN